jgi:hypothetical protein
MAKAYYSVQLFVTSDGGEKCITQANNFNITFNGAKSDVNTFSGLQGFFTGSKNISGSFTVVKSPAGDEQPFEKLIFNPTVCSMAVEGYGDKTIFIKECWFENGSASMSTEAPSSLSVTFKGVFLNDVVS